MKSLLKLTLIVATAAILFPACKSKTNDIGKIVPSNAVFVIHADGKSLSSKLSWDDIKQNGFFKAGYNDSATKDWIKKIMDNPENSGIDTKNDWVIFGQLVNGNLNVVIEGGLKDAKAFEQFNKNATEETNVTKDNAFSTMQLKHDGVVTWNDKRFAYVLAHSVPKFRFFDPNTPAETNDLTALASYSKAIFNLKADSSLGKNEKFTDLMKEEGDIHTWLNAEEMMKSMPNMGALSMLKLDDFIKNNISTNTVTFNDGKISVKRRSYVSKELMDISKKYISGGINTEMIKNIPSQNVLGIMTLKIKPEGMSEMIKLTGMDGLANMMLVQQGLSIDDFVKATNGEFMLLFSDLAVNDSTHKMPANVLFATGIGDKAAFKKVTDLLFKSFSKMNDSSIAISQNDKYFVIGNNRSAVDRYLAGGNSSYAFTDKIKDHSFGLFIDLAKILSTGNAQHSQKDTLEAAMMDASIKMWENILMTGGDIKDNSYNGSIEINLVDKKTNSLKQLNNYFNTISGPALEKKKKRQEYMLMDTAKLTPAIDTMIKKL